MHMSKDTFLAGMVLSENYIPVRKLVSFVLCMCICLAFVVVSLFTLDGHSRFCLFLEND